MVGLGCVYVYMLFWCYLFCYMLWSGLTWFCSVFSILVLC